VFETFTSFVLAQGQLSGRQALNPAVVVVPVAVLAILLGLGLLLYQRRRQQQRIHAYNSSFQHDFGFALGMAHEDFAQLHPTLGYTPLQQVPR